jgi:O-antigen ligase
VRVAARATSRPFDTLAFAPWLLLLLCVAAALEGHTYHILALSVAFLAVVCVYSFPLLAVAALFPAAILPDVLRTTGLTHDGSWAALPGGLLLSDLVLFAMLGAIIARVLLPKAARASSYRPPVAIAAFAAAFFLWMMVEVVRNLGAHGISALGEFRFFYLLLVLPAYVVVFFRTSRQQRNLLRLALLMAVPLTLAMIPLIGSVKGWSVGPKSRFYPADISLALMYGLAVLAIVRSHAVVRVPAILVLAAALMTLPLVLLDGHRSVWLAAAILVLGLVATGELPVSRVWKWGTLALLLTAASFTVAAMVGLDPFSYVTSRGKAFVAPTQDPTSEWRLAIWKTELARFAHDPLAGEGFGGYFNTYIPELHATITVFPHSLYVLTLVKLGLVGLALYLLLIVSTGWYLLRTFLSTRGSPHAMGRVLVTLALVILVASHAYYAAYGLDYYSGIWVGLGLAAAIRMSSSKPDDAVENG